MFKKPHIHKTNNRPKYYLLSNKELILLTKRGDARAHQALKDRKHVRRMLTVEASLGTYLTCELSNGLMLEFENPGSGRAQMSISIEEGTSLSDIKDGWKEIAAWRELLLRFQGPWRACGDDGLYSSLYDRQKGGESYAKLARSINSQIETQLKQYVFGCLVWKNATPFVEQGVVDWEDISLEFGSGDDMGLTQAKILLRSMGLKNEEIDLFCKDTIECLERQELPFWTDGPKPYTEPITREHVITRLRIWRKNNEAWLKERKRIERWKKEGSKNRRSLADRFFERQEKERRRIETLTGFRPNRYMSFKVVEPEPESDRKTREAKIEKLLEGLKRNGVVKIG